ncbi:hypothetical protein A5637_20660 [Mycolicibacterium fortuitum]|uniref:hypothetical protein n=1 Tax=Mycolicibacterium fortuitum TaxID=1766 RepID=UPI0007ECFA45|nr:hypothetical protein [Mycolicibacterium fortuitum]OBK12968.1 hypothetical protein A5637_20660 [Mycolicibacterium fortuitum]
MTVPTVSAPAIPTQTDIALALDQAVNMVDLIRGDLNKVFPTISESAPLFAVVDILTALGHLRHAAVAIDKAADAIEAAGVAR